MKRLLLDTHAFVWWATGSSELSSTAIDAIERADNVAVSLVTLWEIVLKEATKHPVVGTDDAGRWFSDALAETNFRTLGIEATHLAAVQHLPPVHSDPFDRLLVTQAIATSAALVTRDRTIPRYKVDTLW